jgi:signal recognition particle subunit SRP54
MTPGERARPEIIDKSRASRIARGSGRRSKEVRELVGRFGQMREMMAAVGGRGGGLLSRIPGLGRGAGALDPSALLGPAGGAATPARREPARSRSRQKDKRRQARRARKKNRRR